MSSKTFDRRFSAAHREVQNKQRMCAVACCVRLDDEVEICTLLFSVIPSTVKNIQEVLLLGSGYLAEAFYPTSCFQDFVEFPYQSALGEIIEIHEKGKRRVD